MAKIARCTWPGEDPIYVAYHDEEWGVPERDDVRLYEKLVLDGFQAGLSWITILKKRDNFRRAFGGFDPQTIARWNQRKVEALMKDTGIVRNRAKIESAIANAKGWIRIMEEQGSFSEFIWDVTGGRTIHNRWKSRTEVPAETEESRALSKKLKSYDFNFVGPTIVYAFMQAVGMVNDHVTTCFRHAELAKPSVKRSSPRRRASTDLRGA
jgi:DNA-3-methyladenine glycosylase I